MNNQKNFFSRLLKKEKDVAPDFRLDAALTQTPIQEDTSFEDSLGEEMRPFNTPKTYENEQTKSAHRIL